MNYIEIFAIFVRDYQNISSLRSYNNWNRRNHILYCGHHFIYHCYFGTRLYEKGQNDICCSNLFDELPCIYYKRPVVVEWWDFLLNVVSHNDGLRWYTIEMWEHRSALTVIRESNGVQFTKRFWYQEYVLLSYDVILIVSITWHKVDAWIYLKAFLFSNHLRMYLSSALGCTESWHDDLKKTSSKCFWYEWGHT